jgi:hypothetical protein
LTTEDESNVATTDVDDNSCYDEEHTYRVEYEVAGGTESENEDGTKKKRKFDSSAEDSDLVVNILNFINFFSIDHINCYNKLQHFPKKLL